MPVAKTLKTCEAQDAAEWREWLAGHHASESEVWLVFYKRHTGRPCVSYEDAVDEALCFGWIDSLIKRLDDDRYARKFTPRKPDSRWSTPNRERFRQLQASGRLTPAGFERPPTERSGDAPRPSTPDVPRYIKEGLRNEPAAWEFFENLAPSHRRQYVMWIDSAKQPDTKARRLEKAIRILAAGDKLGMK
jgi:uncharacterized protein YdeI (YjbR/CyaY-like superfamily)